MDTLWRNENKKDNNKVKSSAEAEDAAQLSSSWLICARTEIPVVVETRPYHSAFSKLLSVGSSQQLRGLNVPYFLSTFSYTFLHCGSWFLIIFHARLSKIFSLHTLIPFTS